MMDESRRAAELQLAKWKQITAAEAKRLLISNGAEQLPDQQAGKSHTINI